MFWVWCVIGVCVGSVGAGWCMEVLVSREGQLFTLRYYCYGSGVSLLCVLNVCSQRGDWVGCGGIMLSLSLCGIIAMGLVCLCCVR